MVYNPFVEIQFFSQFKFFIRVSWVFLWTASFSFRYSEICMNWITYNYQDAKCSIKNGNLLSFSELKTPKTRGCLLVLSLKEGLVECAIVWVKSMAIGHTNIHGAIKNEGYFEIINEAKQKVVCPVSFRQTKQIQTLMIFFRLDIKIIDKWEKI